MITQELLGYIKAEIAKGKTREEIRGVLLSGGGWSEDDLSEAFRTIIPMQSVILPKEKIVEPSSLPSLLPKPPPLSSPAVSFSPSSPHPFSPLSYSPSPSLLKSTPLSKPLPPPLPSHLLSGLLKFLVVLIIIGGLGFGFWHYRPQIMNFWSSLESKIGEIHLTQQPVQPPPAQLPPAQLPTVQPPPPVQPVIISPIDCGTSTTPKLGVPSTYENSSVFSCLGASAVSCGNAKGILKDDFFPTIFEIIKKQNSCDFKLSYPTDSPLTDITGKKLAGQYISCPLDIVKTIDNTKPASPKFLVPDKTDLNKYASDIYIYGTLGLFIENNLDQNRIQAIGCSGEYIQSVIASYNVKK